MGLELATTFGWGSSENCRPIAHRRLPGCLSGSFVQLGEYALGYKAVVVENLLIIPYATYVMASKQQAEIVQRQDILMSMSKR
jgi:hypothetical protein